MIYSTVLSTVQMVLIMLTFPMGHEKCVLHAKQIDIDVLNDEASTDDGIWEDHKSRLEALTQDESQILVPLKVAQQAECTGIETFEKVNGIDLPPSDRIPLYSSTSGAITADCYNRCRSSSSCAAFWIDYSSSACYRLGAAVADSITDVDVSRSTSYFERLCLQGTSDVCSKAWVTDRVPGYELTGYDDVVIRSVLTRKRCTELCITDKKLPCRSADYWESRKECRLSREDRRTQPGAFIRSSPEVEYIENSCAAPVASKKGRECEWEVMYGYEFAIGDFSTKAESLDQCQRHCETYAAFTCRSVSFDSLSGVCFLSGADMSTTSTRLLKQKEHKIYAQRVPCVDMSLECNGESMVARLKTHSPFYGKMYSSISSECETFGSGKLTTTIEYPLTGCGIYKDVDGSFVGNLIVQQHPLIQKRGDAAFRLVCTFPEINRTLSQSLGFEKESESRLVEASAPGPILGIATSIINSTAKAPEVSLRILDRNGNDVSGVSLGDDLTLQLDVEPNSAYGVFAKDLIAKSGTNEEELVLLDSRGCPEDPAIFPHLKSSDGSKTLKARFEAFKFTNDAVVRFQVYLQFCRHECPSIRCDGEVSHGKRKRREESDDQKNIKKQDFIELKKEIIVLGPSGSRKSKSLEKAPTEDEHTVIEDASELCGPRNLIISIIIGFCILQIIIVFACTFCVCHSSKDQLVAEPTYRTSDLYYARPSTVFNTLRTMRRIS